MDLRGRGDSECESIGWPANGGGKVADDQIRSDGNRSGNRDPEAAAVQIGDSDRSSCRTKSAIEVLHSDGQLKEGAMSERTSSASSGSKAKQREECVLGISGRMASSRITQVEERATPLEAFPGSGRGAGELFHEEGPPLTSNAIHDNSLAGEGVGSEDTSKGWHRPNVARSKSAPVEHTSGVQNLPRNVLELAVRLSDSLGMAVATVFHEVFERNGDFRSCASPVDELSGLLGAALKESLFPVLGNERAIFVGNFRNSFRSTYQTIRSVRRAYAKSSDKLTSSRQRSPRSRRASQSKPRRFSPSQSYRERAGKTLDGTFSLDHAKHPEFGNRAVARRIARTRHPNHTVEFLSEEETTSFTPKRYAQHGGQHQFPCSSGKSCLDESLQSAFFTNTTRDSEGFSDTAGSCSKSCLNESLESSFFTSSNPDRGRQAGSAKSCSMNSANESMGSLQPVPTPDARDVHSELLDSEDSWDGNMFSATSSTVSDDFVIVDKNEAPANGQNERSLAVTFASWTPRKDQKPARRVIEYETSPPPKRCVVDSMKDAKPAVASYNSGTSLSGDSLQGTKSVGFPDSPGSQNRNSLNPGPSPVMLINSSGGVAAHSTLDHPGGRPIMAQSSQGRTFGASSEIGESALAAGESSTNLEHTSRGASSFGRPYESEAANYENTLVHRRLVWEEDTQLAGPSREDTLLPPFFTYGVRANTRQALLERYVEAQETQNHLKQLELAHSMKRFLVKKDHLQIQSESNVLMRENVDLSRSKIELKEFELEDGKLSAAYRDLSQACADELVAGLCVMLLALAYSAWKFSYTRLSRVVTMCQLPPREPRHGGWLGTNWMANAMDAVTGQMQALTCEVTKAGRMLAGLILIALITSALLRRSVTSSSQTMPATIIIVVLGGICGLAGKISIDSLGGDGYLWLLFWESLCFLHAFATTCTPWLHKYLYGPSSKFYQSGASSWMKLCSIFARFSFHTFLAFVLPVMTGLLPFASVNELNTAFWELWEAETIIGPY